MGLIPFVFKLHILPQSKKTCMWGKLGSLNSNQCAWFWMDVCVCLPLCGLAMNRQLVPGDPWPLLQLTIMTLSAGNSRYCKWMDGWIYKQWRTRTRQLRKCQIKWYLSCFFSRVSCGQDIETLLLLLFDCTFKVTKPISVLCESTKNNMHKAFLGDVQKGDGECLFFQLSCCSVCRDRSHGKIMSRLSVTMVSQLRRKKYVA